MRARVFLVASSAGLLVDQVSKLLIFALVEVRPEGARGPAIIPGFLYITLKKNYGISFGFLRGVPPELLIAMNLVIAGLLVYFCVVAEKGERDWRIDLAVGGIVAGAVGNVIDRLHAGAVLDFIDVYIPAIDFDYPVFNVADILIVVGLVAYLVLSWKREKAGDGKKPGARKAKS